jgi:hypothetical protein
VVGSAAGDHENLVDVAQLLDVHPLLIQHDSAVDEMPAQRIADRIGLFFDLLEHEVVMAALFRRGEVPIDVERRGLRGVAGEISDLVAVAGDRHHLVLAELDSIASVVDERRDVGGNEVLACTHAHDQRRRATRRDNQIGFVCVRDDERECPVQPPARCTHRRGQVATAGVLRGDEMRGGLGVGITGQLHPAGFQLGA